jgi:protein gp37
VTRERIYLFGSLALRRTVKTQRFTVGRAEIFPLPSTVRAAFIVPVYIELAGLDSRDTAHYVGQAIAAIMSCELLLGPLGGLDLDRIGWVIAGGESGPHHRPMQMEWVRELRDRGAEVS